uniref:TSA: Wollemia nobilis Ref_Wollemi_Transcript_11442_880 transcribed RNA sequence n=1 Tax=Wollemia nobilis TaxID=56998 RepID=A0A0C9S698_9CONI
MAARNSVVFVILALVGIQAVLGEKRVECEKLPVDMCAFAVSSSGARCVLEKKYSTINGRIEYECQSSAIMAEKMIEWIESEECLQACGLERMNVGLSSDDLVEYSPLSSKLCSDKCQNNCPNIVDIYFSLAAGEGVYLPKLCDAHKSRSRRMMLETAPAPRSILGGVKASIPTASVAAFAPRSS